MKNFLCLFLAAILLCGSLVSAFAVPAVTKEDEDIAVSVRAASAKNKKDLPVEINAKAAFLTDVSTGRTLLEYNADEKLFPASVTKIMTMLLIAESLESGKISLKDKVECSANASSKGGSQIWLEEGEIMTVDELLKSTAVGSANDAATLLGEYVAGSEQAFVDMMNKRAAELGMKNTHFVNATGLDDEVSDHLTTARDISVMSRELLKHDMIKKYTTIWMDSLRGGETELVNTNKLVRFYDGTTGLKTGTTSKAGCCISASAEREGLHLVAVVLGCENSSERFETAKAMLNWGFSNYCIVTPDEKKFCPKEIPVIFGTQKSVSCTAEGVRELVIEKDREGKIEYVADISEDVEAPVEKGQLLGNVKVVCDGETIATFEISAETAVEKLSFKEALRRILSHIVSGRTEFR